MSHADARMNSPAADTAALMADIGRRATRRRAAAGHRRARSARTPRSLAMAEPIAARRDRRSSPPTPSTSPNGEEAGLSPALIDRLKLTPERIARHGRRASATIAALADPVGEVIAAWDRPNGLHIERVRTPLGVIGVIYESRPNVTADAGALCLKAGNAVILRGGSDSLQFLARDPCLPGRGAEGRRPARGRDPAGADHRPRRGRRNADGPRRQSRRHRAARRQEPGRARAGRGARAGLRASRRHLPRLCRPLGRSRHGGRDRRSTPRCGAPASAARPRRCWSTARSPRTHLVPILDGAARGRLRGARRRRGA